MKRPTRAVRACFAAAFLILAAADSLTGVARAASYEIVPVRVELLPGQATASITVRNLTDQPSTVQVRPFGWTQEGDRDVLTPTQEIALSPPLFKLEAGQQQTVRFVLRNPAETTRRTFRLLFDELPPPSAPGQIQMAMRVSVPVVIEAAGLAKVPLKWRAAREAAGNVALFVSNPSQSVVRINEIVARLDRGRDVPIRAAADNPYVLPGVERRYVMQGALPPGGTLRLTVTTQDGATEQAVLLPP